MRRVSLLLLLLGPCRLFAQVSYERLVRAESESHNWLTYSGSYRSQRFSALKQITPENVAKLKAAWVYQIREPGIMETTPLVADGVMYLTEPPSTVTALDIRSVRPLWKWSRPTPRDVRALGFPPVNRGVALLGETVFVGTLDAHLVALDAKSGAVRWDKVIADNTVGYAITVAPLAINDKIVVGTSGGEAGIRGFLDAYDAKTSERAWRFWTIPRHRESGHEPWAGDSGKTGAGATWVTGSYDPDLNLLYWGIGNPGPDWNGDARAGDNLYTDSVVALDASTGKLKWHFQFTPHDTHDWDSNHIPVLGDVAINGQMRKVGIDRQSTRLNST